MSRNPYYYDPSDEPEWGDQFDCDVVDAPDGSDAWEVRAHPYQSAEADDYANDCLSDDGYWVPCPACLSVGR